MKVLVTGAAGFIGFHVSKYLCERGDEVVGIDNLNDYYEVSLKEARLDQLKPLDKFRFIKLDIADREAIEHLFLEAQFDRVVHLAAQAGVRYSIENPHAYADSNLVGFLNVLEGCRQNRVEHLVYVSSSSVYGANEAIPFSKSDNVVHPVSLYAATKKLMKRWLTVIASSTACQQRGSVSLILQCDYDSFTFEQALCKLYYSFPKASYFTMQTLALECYDSPNILNNPTLRQAS